MPPSGVNVYFTVPAMLVFITAGSQVPFIPFLERVGRSGASAFWHRGPIWSNSGVTIGSIVTSMVAG